MGKRNPKAAVVAVIVAVGVGSLVAGGTAWSLGASTGAAARPVSTTEDPPTSTRSKVITFDVDAQLHALVDLPEPFPVLADTSDCIDLTVHDGAWPVYSGATITVPGRQARLCPNAGIGVWSVAWYGGNSQTGEAYLDGNATFLLEPDGSIREGMLAWVRSGEHRYSYRPASDDFTGDQFLLTDSFYGDLVSTTLGATPGPTAVPTTAPPASTAGGTATPAAAVAGSPGYAG